MLLGTINFPVARFLLWARDLQPYLDKAGIKLSIIEFVLCAFCGSVMLGLLLAIVTSISWITMIGVSIFLCFICIAFLLRFLIARRARRFVYEFPEALDLIVRGIRAGLPVTEAMQVASKEAGSVVSDVFNEIAGGVSLGLSLKDALRLASNKIAAQEFRFFLTSVTVQQETGGNLADILSNLAQMIRRRDQLRIKIRAMSSEAAASALIIGMLPIIMVGIISTVDFDYISKLFTDPRGVILAIFGACSLLLGAIIMLRMTKFEI